MKNLQLYESYGPRYPQERIELLEEAQEKLGEVIGLVEEALKGSSHQRHAETYILSHLNNWLDSGNRFDIGIQQYIDKFKEEQEETNGEDAEFE